MTYLDRILADGSDRRKWEIARFPVLGASDAAGFAKIESVPLYVAAKLRPSFRGNSFTESGHFWEPRMLAHFGVPENKALIHAIDEPGFAATPDGIEVLPSGEIVLAECKAKHGRVVTGPTRAELRQIWWQQMVMGPDARRSKFIWWEIIDGAPRSLEPHILIVHRDEDEIRKLVDIARPVLDGVRRALAFKEEMRLAA